MGRKHERARSGVQAVTLPHPCTRPRRSCTWWWTWRRPWTPRRARPLYSWRCWAGFALFAKASSLESYLSEAVLLGLVWENSVVMFHTTLAKYRKSKADKNKHAMHCCLGFGCPPPPCLCQRARLCMTTPVGSQVNDEGGDRGDPTSARLPRGARVVYWS